MAEIEKEILDQTKGVAVEVYKDALSPVVKPIGEILGFLPRTIKLALSSWEKWLINGEESLRLTAESIKEKVKLIPEEKLVEPEPYVAIPAIQQISYCQDSKELRDLYANLLISSMNADKKWQVHPSFVDIIKQLSPDEAKYLKNLLPMLVVYHPLIDVDFGIGESPKGYLSAMTNFTDEFLDVLEHPENICAYIDNFIRLNLIEVPEGKLVDMKIYNRMKNHPFIQNPIRDFSLSPDIIVKYSYRYKMFRLTNFGLNFINVVCQP